MDAKSRSKVIPRLRQHEHRTGGSNRHSGDPVSGRAKGAVRSLLMEEDPYRYCVYCGVDCIDYDTIEVSHRPDCPEQTGLYPVEQRELEPHGMMCMDCDQEFSLGDFYVMRPTEDSLTFEVVCVGCGALSACVV